MPADIANDVHHLSKCGINAGISMAEPFTIAFRESQSMLTDKFYGLLKRGSDPICVTVGAARNVLQVRSIPQSFARSSAEPTSKALRGQMRSIPRRLCEVKCGDRRVDLVTLKYCTIRGSLAPTQAQQLACNVSRSAVSSGRMGWRPGDDLTRRVTRNP